MQNIVNMLLVYMKKSLFYLSILFMLLSGEIIKAKTQDGKKICLCMIVRQEENTLPRCLKSVAGIVDFISICDTGSTDKTVQCIQDFINETGIPGVIHNHEWKNFGHNRTLSAQAAQEALKEKSFSLENTYLLFLDADMELQVSADFDKNNLKDDSYLMIQKDAMTTYYNLRLAKASLEWRSIGVTHEYWAGKNALTQSKLYSLFINDRNDGGYKAHKFERDINLLTQGLIDEPDNPRYMFYLAQSYQNTQQWDKAIEWYNKRINQGGWYEEVWMSRYMIGQCYEGKGDWDNALKFYLEAFQSHPTRSEPLSNIVHYYLSKGQNHLACIFANYGKKIGFPEHDVLFVEQDVYNFKLMQALSIGLYYTQFRSKGLKCLDKLLLSKNSPEWVRRNCYNNLFHYVENLKDLQFISIEPEKRSLINDWSSDRYSPMNPCILKTNNGYVLNCRTVNYHSKYPQILRLADDGCMRTKNILIEYDHNLNKMSENIIVDHPNLVKYQANNIQGLEDMRLFILHGELYFTATTCQLHPQGVPQICIGKLQDFKNGFMLVDKVTLLKGPNPDRCEKNWLPFVINDELYIIYLYDPYTIFKVDIQTGACDVFLKKYYKQNFSKFRGSAAPIPFDDGYLLTVHEVIGDKGCYVHRFVYLDKDLEIQKISRPFTFKHKGVEFCVGMTYDEAKNALVLSLGIEDREATLCTVNADYVKSLLDPIEK